MKRRAFSHLPCAAVILMMFALPASARQSARPSVARRVRPETARDRALEAAIADALFDGDACAAAREGARYDYNRVDLDGDGQPETLVYLFSQAWCGSAGCTALVFEQQRGKYVLVTNISGVENPIIVSRDRSHGWRDLVAHVRWGERDGRTVRDYYAVLRYDGATYPDQFPGAPALRGRRKVSGVAYFSDGRAPRRGLAFASCVDKRHG